MDYFYTILIRLIVVFTALPIHEYAHGYVAYKLGDNTAKYSGRLTLNPLSHFDLIGSTMLLFTGFGFAKPVPVNPLNFKNSKSGMALTALAGPVSNILLAYVLIIISKICLYTTLGMSSFSMVLITTLNTMIIVNLQLAVFNLLPIPPLDGSKVIGYFLSNKANFMMYKYQKYLIVAVFILIYVGVLSTPLSYAASFLYNILNSLSGFVEVIFNLF